MKISLGDYDWEKNLKCPYCGYVEEAYYDIFRHDDDLAEIDCSRCEREFIASLVISHDFKIWRKE